MPTKSRLLQNGIMVAALVLAVRAPSPFAEQSGLKQTPTKTPAEKVSLAEVMKIRPLEEILGDPKAPVTIIEYGDYQCPFCTSFATETQPEIVRNYVNKGKVRMVFRNSPFLGTESTAAAQAAACALEQKKLWPYHDALFAAKAVDEARESEASKENNGTCNRSLFLALARKMDLDLVIFTSCLDSGRPATAVAQEKARATADGVAFTPVFFVNGKRIDGAKPYAEFQAIIEAALKG